MRLPKIAASKRGPLLVDHAADRERAPRAGSGAPHRLDRNERGHDAERPVERPAVEHRVHV